MENKWIPVTDELPEPFELVLVTTVDQFEIRRLRQGWWNGDLWRLYYGNDKVIAWMPLPKPYDGEVD
jgi:hypothetical protein